MIIAPLQPIKIRLPSGEVRALVPGHPVDLSDEDARKLLARAPTKVRRVPEPGEILSWESPLLGDCCGEVVATDANGATVWHPVTERLSRIPWDWMRHGTLRDDKWLRVGCSS